MRNSYNSFFFTNHSETLQTSCSWSVDVHVFWGYDQMMFYYFLCLANSVIHEVRHERTY